MQRDIRGRAQPHIVPFAGDPDKCDDGADAPCLYGDEHLSASDTFDLAFDGEHEIEYWIWNGARLVPALPDEIERIQQREAGRRQVPLSCERPYDAGLSHAGLTSSHRLFRNSTHAIFTAILRIFRPDHMDVQDALRRGA